jgi:ergothioneine biosynthesis protein EgtB
MLHHSSTSPTGDRAGTGDGLSQRLFATRDQSLAIAAPLSAEDMTVQPMDDASPTKWHLAHVTWFFETFLLSEHLPRYQVFDDAFAYCFNSYYESLGARQPRPLRGLLSRPSTDSVLAYRAHVDAGLHELLAERKTDPAIAKLVEVGIQHEQQHQELMLTDILALFAANPLHPTYVDRDVPSPAATAPPMRWIARVGGVFDAGYRGDGFCWDNERPSHKVLLHPYRIADRLVTNGEWLEFMREGGYREPLLWLSDGWTHARQHAWEGPGYWRQRDGEWHRMSLHGLLPVDPAAPVTHISYYEADAFARWAGKRLPTEHEWEIAAARIAPGPVDLQSRPLSPQPVAGAAAGETMQQAFGEVWQWTGSAYLAYPGYRPAAGAIGEYNGKFMVSQHVLRGSSCVTPQAHARLTYRNFFYPHQRWQFTGVRLAETST